MSDEFDRIFSRRLNLIVTLLVALALTLSVGGLLVGVWIAQSKKPADVSSNVDATREQILDQLQMQQLRLDSLRSEITELRQTEIAKLNEEISKLKEEIMQLR